MVRHGLSTCWRTDRKRGRCGSGVRASAVRESEMDSRLDSGDPRRLGGYELLGRLGEGGMGTVFLGRDPHGRLVAVKVVRPELSVDDAEFRRPVPQRGQPGPAGAAVLHRRGARRRPRPRPALPRGGVRGRAQPGRGGPRAGARSSRVSLHSVAVGVATALTAIHGAGVIHRDLKPGNVLFALGGLKVIDFGIARALEADQPAHPHRSDGRHGRLHGAGAVRPDGDQRSARPRTSSPGARWSPIAATGRTPFDADSAPATAVRILTQPPD